MRERLQELENRLVAITSPNNPSVKHDHKNPSNLAQLRLDLALAMQEFDSALADAGLDAGCIDTGSEHWLELLADAHDARRNFEQINAQLKVVSAEKYAAEETLFRFLSRQGEAPRNGTADLDSLSAGLDRVATHTANKP